MSNAVNTPDADRGNNVENRPVTSTPSDRVGTDDTTAIDRRNVVSREKDAFGGMKFGSCFFGWLTASGSAVLLAGLVTGVGAALGLSRTVDVTNPTPAQTESIVRRRHRLAGDHFRVLPCRRICCGSDGPVQRAEAGPRCVAVGRDHGHPAWRCRLVGWRTLRRLARVNSFPRLPLNEGTLTTGGIIVAIGVVAASLVGALLGGLAGMRYHRRVDRAGLGR